MSNKTYRQISFFDRKIDELMTSDQYHGVADSIEFFNACDHVTSGGVTLAVFPTTRLLTIRDERGEYTWDITNAKYRVVMQ